MLVTQERQMAPIISENQQLYEIATAHGLSVSITSLEHSTGKYGHIIVLENRPLAWKPYVLAVDFDNTVGGTRTADHQMVQTDLEAFALSLGCAPGDATKLWQETKQAAYVEEIPQMPPLFNHHRHSLDLTTALVQHTAAPPEAAMVIQQKIIHIVQSNIARIPYYPDVPEVLKRITEETDDVAIVMCTRGYALPQWKKTARWLEQYPDVDISAICLSAVPKGPFLKHWFLQLQKTDPLKAAAVKNILMWDDSAFEIETVVQEGQNALQPIPLSGIRIQRDDTPDRDTPTPPGIPTIDIGNPYQTAQETAARIYEGVIAALRTQR